MQGVRRVEHLSARPAAQRVQGVRSQCKECGATIAVVEGAEPSDGEAAASSEELALTTAEGEVAAVAEEVAAGAVKYCGSHIG